MSPLGCFWTYNGVTGHSRPRVAHCIDVGCSSTHGPEAASRCDIIHTGFFLFWDAYPIMCICLSLRSIFAVTHRWATVSTDPGPSSKPGWKNHWDASWDWQLGAAAHVGVTRVPALKGVLLPAVLLTDIIVPVAVMLHFMWCRIWSYLEAVNKMEMVQQVAIVTISAEGKKKFGWENGWLVNVCLVLNELFLLRTGGWGDRCPAGSPGEGMLS